MGIVKAIRQRIVRLNQSDSGEAKEIAEFISNNIGGNMTTAEQLTHAIAMCEAFHDWADSLKEELELLRDPAPPGESDADYRRTQRAEDGNKE